MRRIGLVLVLLAAGALAPVAAAHIEVLPATVAPGDPALFTIVVPNERDDTMTAVEMQIPAGLVPFSFEETPGWARTEKTNADGSIDTVLWEGTLPAGSFVRLSFLASTPEQEGDLAFPAVQTYADGTKVRWIGPPEADEPAAIVAVSSAAPRQNAGGEGQTAEPTATAASGEQEVSESTDQDGGSDLALVLAIAGLAVGLVALVVVLAGRRRRT